MSVYQATVDPAIRNTSHTLMLELVGADKAVLDVGCASGYLAEALGKNGCLVSGIEYDERDAEKARQFLQELVVADLNTDDLAGLLPPSSFDTIVFGDVLEHLMDPAGVLKSSLTLLRPGGSIVISIPNVAHGAVRLALLQGRWNYTPTGLLDRTHIRFFTLETLLAMLDDAGLVVTDLRATVADPLATEIVIDGEDLPPEAVDWVRHHEHSHNYQYVLSAELRTDEHGAHPTVVQPAVPIEPVYDTHTERVDLRVQLEQLQATSAAREAELLSTITALKRQVLTSRDHAIGAEAQIGRLRAELRAAQQEIQETRLDAIYAHSELAKAIKDAQSAHARLAEALHARTPLRQRIAIVVGPRTWRLLTAPLRPFRSALRSVRR